MRKSIFQFLYKHRVTCWSQAAFRCFHSLRRLDRPIFIVGMQRSGTSFLSDCVTSSPQIACFGEMNDMWDPLGYPWEKAKRPRPYWFLDPEGYVAAVHNDVGEQYFRAVPGICSMRLSLEKEKSRFLNKCPMNTLRIPLFRELFPDACFISIVRHPLAVIRSAAEKIAGKISKHPHSSAVRNANGTVDFDFNGTVLTWHDAVARFAKSLNFVTRRQFHDLRPVAESQKHFVRYEDFVRNIHGELRAIDQKFGIDSTRRPWQCIPAVQPSRNDRVRLEFDRQTSDIVVWECTASMEQAGYRPDNLAA